MDGVKNLQKVVKLSPVPELKSATLTDSSNSWTLVIIAGCILLLYSMSRLIALQRRVRDIEARPPVDDIVMRGMIRQHVSDILKVMKEEPVEQKVKTQEFHRIPEASEYKKREVTEYQKPEATETYAKATEKRETYIYAEASEKQETIAEASEKLQEDEYKELNEESFEKPKEDAVKSDTDELLPPVILSKKVPKTVKRKNTPV